MAHNIRLFAGSRRVLAPYEALHPMARLFALTANADVVVLPVDDDLHDAMHQAYGTGEWLEGPPLISSGDMAFAARASEAGPLAFLETSYFGGGGHQAAVLWTSGLLALGPMVMKASDQERRPARLWPINAALRSLGVVPEEGEDEFQAMGLGFYRSNEDIWSMAGQVPRLQ